MPEKTEIPGFTKKELDSIQGLGKAVKTTLLRSVKAVGGTIAAGIALMICTPFAAVFFSIIKRIWLFCSF